MTSPQPTLAGFLTFLQTNLNPPAKALPAGSPWPGFALARSLALVNPALECDPIPSTDAAGVSLNSGGWTIYSLACYYLSTDILINIAPDQPGFTFFADLRKSFNIGGYISGVVQASSDEGTSVSLVVQEAAQHFTLSDIQRLKTPYGAQYLMLAQSWGPTTFGMS